MFFTAIHQMMTESVDLMIVIRKSNGQLTVSTLPKSNGLKDEAQNHIVPLTVTGTPEELDTGFMQAVTRPIQKVCGLISNMAQFEAQADKAAAGSKASIARTIHQYSDRHSAPFVAVNCGAIPGELAASLFFGHGKGAFTGADQAKPGYFEMARGGTLFLDEIGTLPYGIQSVLLRVLQEETYIPVGEQKERTADVRIIAATNEDMEQAISERRFREDLYHRISEFEIIQPALKDCPEDILPMADFFRKRFSAELGKRTDGFTREAEAAMLVYHWPGNIRELKNRVKRAVLLSEETLVGMEYLNLRMKEDGAERFRETACCMGTDERQEIVRALQATRGHRKKAAELLGINPATLYRKMNKYGLK